METKQGHPWWQWPQMGAITVWSTSLRSPILTSWEPGYFSWMSFSAEGSPQGKGTHGSYSARMLRAEAGHPMPLWCTAAPGQCWQVQVRSEQTAMATEIPGRSGGGAVNLWWWTVRLNEGFGQMTHEEESRVNVLPPPHTGAIWGPHVSHKRWDTFKSVPIQGTESLCAVPPNYSTPSPGTKYRIYAHLDSINWVFEDDFFHFLLDFRKAFLSRSLILGNRFSLRSVLKHEINESCEMVHAEVIL